MFQAIVLITLHQHGIIRYDLSDILLVPVPTATLPCPSRHATRCVAEVATESEVAARVSQLFYLCLIGFVLGLAIPTTFCLIADLSWGGQRPSNLHQALESRRGTRKADITAKGCFFDVSVTG